MIYAQLANHWVFTVKSTETYIVHSHNIQWHNMFGAFVCEHAHVLALYRFMVESI